MILKATVHCYRAASQNDIHSLKSYLSTIVTRLCLDYLKSARVEREQYVGVWLPEPVLTTDVQLLPGESLEQRESISLAFLVLLETLTPPERAVFLLHQVFDYPFEEIAQIIGKSTANCRQLFHRAKQHVAEHRPRFTPSPTAQRQLITRFLAASQSGDLPALTEMLAQDVTSWSDGGGKVSAALRPIFGREAVARLCTGVARKITQRQVSISVTVEEVNGNLALLIWEKEKLTLVLTFENADEQHIQEMHTVLNPDKLAYIERQLAGSLE